MAAFGEHSLGERGLQEPRRLPLGARVVRDQEDVVAGLQREPQKRQPSVLEFANDFSGAATQPPAAGKGGLLGSLKGMFGGSR